MKGIKTYQFINWIKPIVWLICIEILLVNCNTYKDKNASGLHFSILASDQTNIDFNNKVTETDSVNFYTNEYMYIGAGVGIGDFNNDGLQDIFFCGSQVNSKLYINKGNFKFEDITESSGIHTKGWCLGASVVDINNDGLPDIYICVSQSPKGEERKNLLYINKGNLKFDEEAADYGLADTGYSTQAAFFDYDHDGDLDMYLLNHRRIIRTRIILPLQTPRATRLPKINYIATMECLPAKHILYFLMSPK